MKIKLTKEELVFSLSELKEKYNMSKTTAYRCLKRGYRYDDYHGNLACKKFSGKKRTVSTKRKNISYLSEHERDLSPSKLSEKYGFAISTAKRAKKRGWFCLKGKKLYVNKEINKKLNVNKIQQEVNSSVMKAYERVKFTNPSLIDDCKQHAWTAILGCSGLKSFNSFSFRYRVMYQNSINFFIKEINRKEKELKEFS